MQPGAHARHETVDLHRGEPIAAVQHRIDGMLGNGERRHEPVTKAFDDRSGTGQDEKPARSRKASVTS